MRRLVAEPLAAAVNLSIANAQLEQAIGDRIARALRLPHLRPARVVRARTRKRLATLDLTGRFLIVRVTAGNARHLLAMVDAARPTAAGIQLVWDGDAPPRARVERHVFAVLEKARATPQAAPVVLAANDELALALRILAAKEKEIA